jgi:hypothetical protein
MKSWAISIIAQQFIRRKTLRGKLFVALKNKGGKARKLNDNYFRPNPALIKEAVS